MSTSISTERELSDFEPIVVEINEVPNSLELKIRKQKGEIKNINLINKEIEKESGELYWQAKKKEVKLDLINMMKIVRYG